MPDFTSRLKKEFKFGSTTVRILEGDIKNPGVDVDVIVSTDDNHLTMASGVSQHLAQAAGPKYVSEAHAPGKCPVKAGSVVQTKPYKLKGKSFPSVKKVFHAAVIDYDTADQPLEDVVKEATENCLEQAEELRMRSILFPAFASGAGRLDMQKCARQMCSAIKDFLARERRIKEINLILYLPDKEGKPDAHFQSINQGFIKEANLILDVPYDPEWKGSQVRELYGRDKYVARIEEALDNNKHVVILAGPRIGKSALLDHFLVRLDQPTHRLYKKKVKPIYVPFGVIPGGTPCAFIYRKLLLSLRDVVDDEQIIDEITKAYADADIDTAKLLSFLQNSLKQYSRIVFFIDNLFRLLQPTTLDFFRDLDALQERAQFVFTASYEQYNDNKHRLGSEFKKQLAEIELGCTSDQEREEWMAQLYKRYLGGNVRDDYEAEFFQKEAGHHPYLISLIAHAFIKALKEKAIRDDTPIEDFDNVTLDNLRRRVLNSINAPRRAFFDMLLKDDSLTEKDKHDLRKLAEAVYKEGESRKLLSDIDNKDPKAMVRFKELLSDGDPRDSLHRESLELLEKRGYLVGASNLETARFVSQSFAEQAQIHFQIVKNRDDQPKDVVIGLLSPEPEVVVTLFGRRGARLVSAQKRLTVEFRQKFMESFRNCINNMLHPTQYPDPGEFANLEKVASFIMTYFVTGAIKSYLQNPPKGATVLLTVDEGLKDIPWELMLESAYGGEDIPFRVGRSIVSQQPPHNIKPPVRGEGKIRALLIGDPTGDLSEAGQEVKDLRINLIRSGRFEVEESDVLIGPDQCKMLTVLSKLNSERYGLIHYSGHTKFDGNQSAWYLPDGKITTDMLTSALQNAPPVLVFSSSCESAVGAGLHSIKYEDQTFDLPSAFLQAGVEAYIGTLWEVESTAARLFVREFYKEFLSCEETLGECLRQAKVESKVNRNRKDWLAFILYGDPHALPGELFPILKKA